MPTSDVLAEIWKERSRQDEKWGEQNHPNGTGGGSRQIEADKARDRCGVAFHKGEGTWLHVLDEEVAEAFAEDGPELREELIQVAAVAVAWIEAIDRANN